MTATRRRRRVAELERELGDTAKETAGERTLAGEAVRLQELLGNATTTEVLARSPLQRDTAGTEAPHAKEGEEQKEDVTYSMTVDDVGTFDLHSWSWGSSGDSGGSGSGGGAGKAQLRDINATKTHDKHSPLLMQRSSTGEHIKSVELQSQRGDSWFLMRMKDVNVTSFRANDGDPPTETFAISFAEIEYETSEKAAK